MKQWKKYDFQNPPEEKGMAWGCFEYRGHRQVTMIELLKWGNYDFVSLFIPDGSHWQLTHYMMLEPPDLPQEEL